jgi:hypothetical protein
MAETGHEIITGTIGMGKSYLVLYKIVKSLEQGKPLCYIDPKGDTYRNLLSYFVTSPQGRELWAKNRHRILLLNPVSKSDYILGFNALAPMNQFDMANPDRVALLANTLVSFVRKQSGFEVGDANRMQGIMSAAIGLLVGGDKGLTMAELPWLFVPPIKAKGEIPPPYNKLTKRLLDVCQHFGTRTFWETQWATWTQNARQDWPQSTEGRVFQYLFDERTLATTCTSTNARLDFRKLVDEGYFLFVNLPYPLLSDTVSTLLGNLIITKIYYACMQRPAQERQYRIILDEARFFNTGPLDTLLETSRAYNLWLTLVVQSLGQMCRMGNGATDERLLETALNNVRYISAFNNVADTRTLAEIMFPITGKVVTGQRQSGDNEYLPVQAEAVQYQRRFTALRHREVVLYDKFNPRPRVFTTPEFQLQPADQGQIDLFEAQHLQLTGKPLSEIRQEIKERQTWVKELLGGLPKTQTFGGSMP